MAAAGMVRNIHKKRFTLVRERLQDSGTTIVDPPLPPVSTSGSKDEQPPKPVGGTRVTIWKTSYGRILSDSRTLYLFTREKGTKPDCYGDCAKAWPPLIAKGVPGATGDADSKLVGTTPRSDGKRQVTYGGHPVYYYAGESMPGQVLCQNVPEFGGIWLIVKPNGTAVQ